MGTKFPLAAQAPKVVNPEKICDAGLFIPGESCDDSAQEIAA
jgi:hypothetical protein